jgi:CubicO group peptidase (beta-lactamase class C family)
MPDFAPVARLIDEARLAHAFPACAIEVGRRDAALWQWAAGRLTYDPTSAETTLDSIFDLASLTKVIATTPIVMRMVDERRLLLNAPLSAYVTDWRGSDRDSVTIADVLEHAAGLPAWWDLYRRATTAREFAHEIATLPLEYAPRSRSIYSDLGFILIGLMLEEIAGARLDTQFDAAFPHPDLRFTPPASLRPRIAPTTDDRAWRKHLLVGEVEDENAWALGGIAGHAGVFGSARAVGAFARLMLQTLTTTTPLGTPRLLGRFLSPSRVPHSSRALGWDLMRPTSSCGRRLSPSAFGHTGFTGVSLWIDPLKDLYVVLLTNRVHPERPGDASDGLTRLRPAVHDAVVDALER